jgi:hypothetical protein
VAEADRLRAAVAAGAWKRSLAICLKLTAAFTELVNVAEPPGRAALTARAGTNLIPLTDLAHEMNRDRRTVERRLTVRGCDIQRFGRVALVERDVAIAAVNSFERVRKLG